MTNTYDKKYQNNNINYDKNLENNRVNLILDTISPKLITINNFEHSFYKNYDNIKFLQDQLNKQEQIKDQLNKQEQIKEQIIKQEQIKLNQNMNSHDPNFIYTYQSLNELNRFFKKENKRKNILTKIIKILDFHKPDDYELYKKDIQNQIDELKLTYQLYITNVESEFIRVKTIIYKDIIELEQMMMANNLH